jgi:hypothetical protein
MGLPQRNEADGRRRRDQVTGGDPEIEKSQLDLSYRSELTGTTPADSGIRFATLSADIAAW